VLFFVREPRRAGCAARRELRVERVEFWAERAWARVIVWAVDRLASPMRLSRGLSCIFDLLYFTSVCYWKKEQG
jgi:hypothetical protein